MNNEPTQEEELVSKWEAEADYELSCITAEADFEAALYRYNSVENDPGDLDQF